MFVVQVCGYHKSGKTTTVKELINRLKIAGDSVGSIKDIHLNGFQLDQPNKNSYLHKAAGANPVIIRAENETDFLYNYQMNFLNIVQKISVDWLIVEGFSKFPLPKIVCGKTEQEVDDFLDRRTLAISGVFSNDKNEYRGLPVFNPLVAEQANKLWELVKSKVFPMLPYVDEKCCDLCGLTCSKMVEAIIQGEKTYQDCLISQTKVQLKIGNKEIPIVPFVQKILRNNIMALVAELEGWEKGKNIEVIIENQ